MKNQSKLKSRKQSQGLVQEIFETIQPTYFIKDTANGISTKSYTKQIRYQSQNPQLSNQKDLTEFQRTELEKQFYQTQLVIKNNCSKSLLKSFAKKQKRNQEYLFHVGNHARTVSDILKFRYDQYQQALGQQGKQLEEQKKIEQQNQQLILQNSTTMIQQYQKYHSVSETNIKRSNTTNNLKNQKAGVQLYNSAEKQIAQDSKVKIIEGSQKPGQIQSQKAIQSILGSAESNISPIKKSYNEDQATVGDTRDNFVSANGGSSKSNNYNFSFQDRKYIDERDFLSIQRNLFDSIDTQKNSAINNQQFTSSQRTNEEESLGNSIEKQRLSNQQNNQTFQKEDRLLQSPVSFNLNQKSQSQDYYLTQKNPTQQLQQQPNTFIISSQATPNQIKQLDQSMSKTKQNQDQQFVQNQQSPAQFNISANKIIPSLDISQAQNFSEIKNKDQFSFPTQKYIEDLQSTSTLETNQFAYGNRVTEPKFINYGQNYEQSQLQSAYDINSINQPYSTSLNSFNILSTERQFKIKLTKITKDSSISEEYQLNKSPSPFTQFENKQDLLIKFVEDKKQQCLNNLNDDSNSEFSKTPQTNKSEVIKRFKASQIFDSKQTKESQKLNQNKSSQIYLNNSKQNDFTQEADNQPKYTNLISSARQQNLSHQMPVINGIGRINNFVRKSQDGSKQSTYFTQANEQQIQPKQSASFNPNYHLLESYTNSLLKSNNNLTQNPTTNVQNQDQYLQNYSMPQQNTSNHQIYSLNNQGSQQQETKSSLSMIKNMFENSQNLQNEKQQSNTFIGSSPKNEELNIILSRYQSNKEKQNQKQGTQQQPQNFVETRYSFAKSIDQHLSQQNPHLSQTQDQQNQSSQVKNSLTLLENQKIQQIMDDIQAKISLKKSQSLEQSNSINQSSNKFSQFLEQKTKNSQVNDNYFHDQNGLKVSFANNSLVGQSTIESSKNIANQINSNSQIMSQLVDQKQSYPDSSTNYLQYNQMETNSRNEIEKPSSKNNFNLMFESLQNQTDNPQSDRKNMQGDLSTDKSQKEEQDKTFDSENRDEMSIKQTTQFEKKTETLSNTYDMSQFLCQTPLQQHGQHFRLMSGGNMENLTLNNSIQSSQPFDQIQSNQITSYSNFTTQNNLQSTNHNHSKSQEKIQNLQNSFDNDEQSNKIQTRNSQLMNQSQEVNEQQRIIQDKKNSQEYVAYQNSKNVINQRQLEEQQLYKDDQNKLPGTVKSVQINEQQDQNTQEDFEMQLGQITKQKNQGAIKQLQKQQNFNNGMTDNQITVNIQNSQAAQKSFKNNNNSSNSNAQNTEQFNQLDEEKSHHNDQNQLEVPKSYETEQEAFSQDKQKHTQKNSNHVRFNSFVKQMQEASPCQNLGFYHCEGINIDGKVFKDMQQQTELVETKEICVQTGEQSKRNSIFDECTKLFSPKMKFIEPDFKDNECMMINMTNNSYSYDQKDSNKGEQSTGQNQQKNLRKSDFFKQNPNQLQLQQQTSSNGNHETGIMNSSLYNSQKLPSDNEEAIRKQYQIYDKIFDAGELPLVDHTEEDNIFREWYNSDQSNNNIKNRRYSNQISDSEKKHIQQQIENIINKKGHKNQLSLNNQQKNPQNNNQQAKNKGNLEKQANNKINQKSIKFNNKIETRNLPKSYKQIQQTKSTTKVFDRLYPKQAKPQQEQVFEVKKEQSKSKSKGRSSSSIKTRDEMDFIKINKQKVPYMMRKKVEDKFELFKKAVEVNLENMVQDQKSLQIKSIVLDDEINEGLNLQEIYQRSLSNRTQKNLVSYDTLTMTNLARYNPSYNP